MANAIYVHSVSGRKRRDVSMETKVGDLRDDDASALVWLEDADESLDPERTLAESGVNEGAQVHVSRCRRVDVRMRYGGDDKNRTFSPAATIARVFDWATGKDGFNLSAAERAKHTLQVCGQKTQPDRADHVGSYADGECKACFDLAPKERFEG